ncbi:MAG TPA: DUF1559 domain-containing protein [Tepidisphaeraceae bacterium]
MPGILGIIFGIIGLRKTRDPRIGGKGLAITGISLGAASILMSTCMISVMVPALSRAREVANRVKCAHNMRQIGVAIKQYNAAHNGANPKSLEDLISAENLTGDLFVCTDTSDTAAPGSTPQEIAQSLSTGGHLSYVYVGKGLTSTASPQAILLYEPISNHREEGSNFLFSDGHVEFLLRGGAENIISQLEQGHNPPKPGNFQQ